MTTSQQLYHYTCAHRWPKICQSGFLVPTQQPFLAEHLTWLTDLHHVNRAALGLTSELLDCDRGEVRIDVRLDYAVPWSTYANAIHLLPYVRKLLEEPPVEPWHWFVVTTPIPLNASTLRRTERTSRR